MNLAVVVPGDFYALHSDFGWAGFEIDESSIVANLVAASIEHVVMTVPRGSLAGWAGLLDQLLQATIVVDMVGEADWQAYLTGKEIDSISFQSIDNERAMLAGWLVEFWQTRGSR